jgi:hypothetical protein
MEVYLSFVEGVFNCLFDLIFLFETYSIANSNKVIVFLKKFIFNLLRRLYSIFSLNFLKIDLKNFYLDNFFMSLLDSFFLFLASIIDFLLSAWFAVAMGKILLVIIQIFVIFLKFLKIVVFFIFGILLNSMHFLYLRANYRFITSLVRIYRKFLRIPSIILSDFEKSYALKILGRRNQLKYFKNTKFDFLQPLSESPSFKKNIVWSTIFIIVISNILYFLFIFLYINIFFLVWIFINIWMVISLCVDIYFDVMGDFDNYNDFIANEIENKKNNLIDEENKKYLEYYKLMNFNDNKYEIHSYHAKKNE